MKWSRKLGRILGIDVYLHLTFLLLLGFVGLAQIGEVSRSAYVTLRADQSLDEALAEARAAGGLNLAVSEEERFVGLLTPVNVGELSMIRRALANRPPPPVPPVIGAPPVIPDLRPSRGDAT